MVATTVWLKPYPFLCEAHKIEFQLHSRSHHLDIFSLHGSQGGEDSLLSVLLIEAMTLFKWEPSYETLIVLSKAVRYFYVSLHILLMHRKFESILRILMNPSSCGFFEAHRKKHTVRSKSWITNISCCILSQKLPPPCHICSVFSSHIASTHLVLLVLSEPYLLFIFYREGSSLILKDIKQIKLRKSIESIVLRNKNLLLVGIILWSWPSWCPTHETLQAKLLIHNAKICNQILTERF